MPQYQRCTSAGIRTTPQRQQLLLKKIQEHLPGSLLKRGESGKPMLLVPRFVAEDEYAYVSLALVDQNESVDATFVFSMNSATKCPAGVAANVKQQLSSLLNTKADKEKEANARTSGMLPMQERVRKTM